MIKNGDDKTIVNVEYEKNETECFKCDDFITPNHCIGRKNDVVILR